MNIRYTDNAFVGKSINVTFYLYNGGDGSLYYGDAFDMNNASFDIDSSIGVVNKEFGKNSITLELIPKNQEIILLILVFMAAVYQNH